MKPLGIAILTLAHIVAATPAQSGPELGSAHALPKGANVSNSAGLHVVGTDRLVGGGTDYQAYFSRDGMRFYPALGPDVPTLQRLDLRPVSVARDGASLLAGTLATAPQQSGLQARYEHAKTATERYDVGANGVELSWRFASRPAGSGDLTVRYAVDSTMQQVARTADGGVQFTATDASGQAIGGVAIGIVTGIDDHGDRCEGTVRFLDGELQLSLPAGFVDHATYPIVLDPVIGTKIFVDTSTWNDAQPDTAYDASTDRYLVTWRRTFSSGEGWPRAHLVSGAGTLLGGTIFFNAAGAGTPARVANLGALDRFGVVWTQQGPTTTAVQFAAVDASNGAITHTSTLARTSGAAIYQNADIGGVGSSTQQFDRGFVVTYEDNIFDAIRARRIYFNQADQLIAPTAFNVFTDTGGIGSSYRHPAISRCSGLGAKFLVVARRLSGIGPTTSVVCSIVNANNTTVGPTASLGSIQGLSIENPDVDGFGNRWVVAWQQAAGAQNTPVIARRTVRHATASTFELGALMTLGGGIQAASAPTLGYANGRTWLGYHYHSGLSSSLRTAAIDSGSGIWCGDTFSESIVGGFRRIVVATMGSGGDPVGEAALAVFSEANNIYAQRLRNYGTGTLTNLGGGCGSGGVQVFNHEPGIGSSQMVVGVSGLLPSALVTVFNLAPSAGATPCGACEWLPFSITQALPVAFGNATVGFTIPCLPTLVGTSLETQWTTYDPTQAPCALVPAFALSDRWLLTFGQ